jgi:hypothetical protein
MTVFIARIGQDPRPAAELAALGWTNGADVYAPRLAPAVSRHVIPLLRQAGWLPDDQPSAEAAHRRTGAVNDPGLASAAGIR